MPRGFIRALGLVKGAAAGVNAELGHLPKNVAKAIQTAAAEVAAGNWDAQFPIDVYQTGSGTSSNMNANEVIATLANRAGKAGKTAVHPNDHVNQGQSSNDVIPTALRVSAVLAAHEQLLPALVHLRKTLDKKGRSLRKVVKTGRTHLMDAMPLTFEQEFGAWSAQLASAQERIEDSLKRVRRLPLGGTAIGTGINADPRFGAQVAKALKQQTGFKFDSAENKFEGLAAQDDAVELSGQLNALAVALIKIANDLRWMNAGPLAGLGEIELPALQPGSSIMPGKVNPVIPEATVMACAQVIGHHTAITVAGQTGNFQLNVTLPLIAVNLLDGIGLLANVSRLLADSAIAGLKVREDRVAEALARNPILVTALNPIIGYEKAAAIAKRAYKEQRPVLDVALEDSGLDEAELRRLLDPAALTAGGIQAGRWRRRLIAGRAASPGPALQEETPPWGGVFSATVGDDVAEGVGVVLELGDALDQVRRNHFHALRRLDLHRLHVGIGRGGHQGVLAQHLQLAEHGLQHLLLPVVQRNLDLVHLHRAIAEDDDVRCRRATHGDHAFADGNLGLAALGAVVAVILVTADQAQAEQGGQQQEQLLHGIRFGGVRGRHCKPAGARPAAERRCRPGALICHRPSAGPRCPCRSRRRRSGPSLRRA
jgi:fumarate hydratase class II